MTPVAPPMPAGSPGRRPPIWAYPEGLTVCPSCRVAFAPIGTTVQWCSNVCRERGGTPEPTE